MVDSANGVSWELPVEGWSFVPVDLNVVLHRLPEGEWVGMSAATTIEGDGVGMARARLFDAEGSLGGSLHTLFVSPR
jgi:acyl-CoA thioesterase